jgi:hypothetical protein
MFELIRENRVDVRFVSRESACSCDFPAGSRLNGVQEVAGSNPVAPTSKGQSGQ